MGSSRLRYHYENILRQDLLLKLNYANIMQVPRLCKINMLTHLRDHGSDNSVKSVSLALEILCGQKFVERGARKQVFLPLRGTKYSPASRQNFLSLRAKTKTGTLGARSARSSLRSPPLMYNFLDKLITIILLTQPLTKTSYDYTIQIQANTIQITIEKKLGGLFPEIQNHFEFFESAQNLQVIIVTSALTENETQLLWTGLLQKEI
uniref:Ribosomal protein L5 n=1 Tax=Closterium baillyanum TaxID=1416941 RepID=U5YGP4_9VIRI|nr:ribosomal protein L5 [Closterium baillyanum]AGZ90251.1 ribosomal protein L5 [Closterium baillyanum]